MKPSWCLTITSFFIIFETFFIKSSHAACGSFEFSCTADGSCISEELVCDGKADCPSRTDETEDLCSKIRCPRYSFRCSYGACIDQPKVCNGFKDCLDASDELLSNCKEEEENELVGCAIDKYRCRSNECIDSAIVCDGNIDCSDGSDEEEEVCLKMPCPRGFRCRYGACVSRTSRCNGIVDCADGSDEDELLCGAHLDFNLVRANATGKIPPGSCRLPTRNDVRYINYIFGEEYTPGAYVNDGEFIEVMCKGGTAMNVSLTFDYSNSCNNTKWIRKWTAFPECQTICSGADITGRTIKTICEMNEKNVPCNQQHIVGTVAYITCGSYYDMPSELSYLSQKLTCLSTGVWDKVAIRCKPRCGRVTQSATAYVVGGKKAKNIAEVPWAAAIYKRDILICGATIISEKLIISAAHCFYREQPSSITETVVLEPLELFKIAVGKYFRDLNMVETFAPQFFNVSEVVSVPGYDGYMGFFSADFIIVVVDNYILFRQHIVPICVDKESVLEEDTTVQPGLIGSIAGWGFTQAGSSPSDVLKIAKLPTVGYNQCKREAPQNYKQFVTPDKFCAGNVGGGDAVCQGDSGAGLVFSNLINGEEVFYLRGLVSNARQVDGECDLNFYTMFTNIHHYMRFIKSADKRFPSS